MRNTDRISEKTLAKYCEFSLELLRRCGEGKQENILVSPLSVLTALSMLETGACGDTKKELAGMLPEGYDRLTALINDGSKDNPLRSANALFSIPALRNEFNMDYICQLDEKYNAQILTGSGPEAVKTVNGWVKDNTGNMISEIVQSPDQLGDFSVINTVYFADKWKERYLDYEIEESKKAFKNGRGKYEKATMMYRTESDYMESGCATGFIKPYRDSRFSFAAFLPKKGYTPEMFLGETTGRELAEMLRNPADCIVETGMPEYESASEMELVDQLELMGLKCPFDASKADFSCIIDVPGTHISNVLHKTRIRVNREGTKAAAVTVCEEVLGLPPLDELKRIKEVILDRPFIYAVIHSETGIPVFLGKINTLSE